MVNNLLPTLPSNYCLAFFTAAPLTSRSPHTETVRPRGPFLPGRPRRRAPPLLDPFVVPPPPPSLRASSSPDDGETKMRPPPLPRTDDPFLLLGLDPRNPTTDKTKIKRAYRKRAMMYHPDVLLSADSTAAERDVASKDFARINAAYELLTGGAEGGVGRGTGASGGAKAKPSSGEYNYQPPHRRASGTYSSSYGRKSTNWEDYMPNNDEEDTKYDAGGDSFGAIISDILKGAAGAAAGVASGGGYGGGSIFGDFIDFLEGNIDGFESGYYSDDDRLLRYGSFGEVAAEMDETDILVSSLETKLSMVEDELMQTTADLNLTTKYSERLDLEERVAELKAREKVVKGYLKKGKKRLINLRERYKELMVEGRGRGYGSGSGSSSSYDVVGGSASGERARSYSGGGSSTGSNSYGAPDTSNYSSPTASATFPTPSSAPVPASSSSKSWRSEGFSNSYGGRSSSSRRRSSRKREGSTVVGEGVSATSDRQPSQQQRRSDKRSYSSSSRGSNESSSNATSKATTSRTGDTPAPGQVDPWAPPHRRTLSSVERNAEDKKRLRELKVEEDFDKLKREMGM